MDTTNDFITFDEEEHSYTDINGNLYTSVTRLIGMVKQPFPKEKIARAIAKRDKRKAEDVIAEWDAIAKKSTDHGTMVHKMVEDCLEHRADVPFDHQPLAERLDDIFEQYDHVETEKLVYSTDTLVAGRFDNRAFRTKKIIDYSDVKTNVRTGIQYQSKYNKYLLEPLSHLEDCNFNHVALQLSIYAYLDTMGTEYMPGNLSVLHVKDHKKGEIDQIFVPYMKFEVEQLLKHHVEVNNVRAVPKLEIEQKYF